MSLPREREVNQPPITSIFKLTLVISKKQDEQREAGPSFVGMTKEAELTPPVLLPDRVEDKDDEYTPLIVRRTLVTMEERWKMVIRKSTRPQRSSPSKMGLPRQKNISSEKQTKEGKDMTREEADQTLTETKQEKLGEEKGEVQKKSAKDSKKKKGISVTKKAVGAMEKSTDELMDQSMSTTRGEEKETPRRSSKRKATDQLDRSKGTT